MVLSLVDISAHSVVNGMMDGTIQHPHLLSPMIRQRILDMAIKEDLANHPNCLPLLTSVEFLNGMTTISAKACNDNDSKFLERLISSLATQLPNGETIGAGIKEMNLKIFEYGAYGSADFDNEMTCANLISKVSDLIAHCPNMVSLDSHVFKMGSGYYPLNENENDACNRVMENLIDLSIVLMDSEDIIDSDRPIINFKKLTTLKLKFCKFDNDTWPKLLEKIPFVENLHLFDVYSIEDGLDWILPSPLPHLKSLKVLGDLGTAECNKAFVDNLMECPQLRQVHLKLDQTSTDEETLVRLANMDIDLKMKIRISTDGNDAAENASILDSSSRFKLVRIFHEKMVSFELDVWQDWNEQFSKALEDMINMCSNLTSFAIEHPHFRVSQSQIEVEVTNRVNSALVRFFGNPQRAQKLEGLRLIGNFDETVLSTVFDNCLNLVRLDIRQCPNLRDQHLIDWVARGGGKLTNLTVKECNNVTSEGIIPILAKSAEGLLGQYSFDLGKDNGGRNWKTMFRNHCPNAVILECPYSSIS